jgi:hypothetical protein
MSAVAALGGFFSGHPYRLTAAVAFALAGAAAAWYLGSPLFITTFTDEALPIVSPAPVGTAPPSASESMATEARIVARGQLGFVDSLHHGTGEVRIIELGSQRFLRFEDVQISNAPDVHIYLSRDTGGRYVEGSVLYLGPMKATNGSFNYEVPAGHDLGQFRSVVVWCRAFSVLITWADLVR